MQTLSASFVQRNRVKLFRQEMISEGRMHYQRAPVAQLRWEYTSPDPSTLLLVDNRALLLIPGQKARTFDLDRDLTMRAIFEELELWLGHGSLRAAQIHYEMQAGGTEQGPALILRPKASSPLSKAFVRIELRIDARTALLRSLLLVEQGGDEKEILFKRMERNVILPSATFQAPR